MNRPEGEFDDHEVDLGDAGAPSDQEQFDETSEETQSEGIIGQAENLTKMAQKAAEIKAKAVSTVGAVKSTLIALFNPKILIVYAVVAGLLVYIFSFQSLGQNFGQNPNACVHGEDCAVVKLAECTLLEAAEDGKSWPTAGTAAAAQMAYNTFNNAGFSPEDARVITVIAGLQSNWNPKKSGGLLTISNSVYDASKEIQKIFENDKEKIKDASLNARAAYAIYSGSGGKFTTWKEYKPDSSGYKSKLASVEKALKPVEDAKESAECDTTLGGSIAEVAEQIAWPLKNGRADRKYHRSGAYTSAWKSLGRGGWWPDCGLFVSTVIWTALPEERKRFPGVSTTGAINPYLKSSKTWKKRGANATIEPGDVFIRNGHTSIKLDGKKWASGSLGSRAGNVHFNGPTKTNGSGKAVNMDGGTGDIYYYVG